MSSLAATTAQLAQTAHGPRPLGPLEVLDGQLERLDSLLDQLESKVHPIRVPRDHDSNPQPAGPPENKLQDIVVRLEYRLERLAQIVNEIEL